MVSGVLLKYTHYGERSFNKVLFNGINRLILPYFVYSSLLFFARWMASGFDISVFRWQFVDLCSFYGIGATWFLPWLFIAQLIYWFLNYLLKYIKDEIQSKVFMLLVAVVLFVIPCVFSANNFIVHVVFRTLVATFFLVIGTIIYHGLLRLRSSNIWTRGVISIVLLILSIFVFVATGSNVAALNVLNFGNPILYVTNALIGCAMMFATCVCLEKTSFKTLKNVITFYGKESLIIMGTHQVIMMVLRIPTSNSIGLNIVFCIAVLLAEIPIIHLIKKLRKK